MALTTTKNKKNNKRLEISTNGVSRCCYEPTAVPTTLGREAFPLYNIISIEHIL
jgi:hypothetical protein